MWRTNQTIMQSVSFSTYLASAKRIESQNVNIEKFLIIELHTWTGCVVMQKKSSINNKIYTQDITRKTEGMLW